MGQGGSPHHGETNWAHWEGDLGFAGAHHGEGRRGFAGDQCKGAYGALPDLELSAKGQGGGAVSYRGLEASGLQRRDVGGVAARWCSGEQSPCGAWGRGRRERLQATSSSTWCSSAAQGPELAFEVAVCGGVSALHGDGVVEWRARVWGGGCDGD